MTCKKEKTFPGSKGVETKLNDVLDRLHTLEDGGETISQEDLDAKINITDGLVEDITYNTNSADTYSVLTQAEYDGIGTPDENTLYFII